MAKTPKKTANDPATLAFSAVEDALKDSVAAGDKPSGRKAAAPERDKAARKIARRANPANDDRLSSSKILTGMQARPSSSPFWIAVTASVAWLVIIAFAGWLRFGEDFSNGNAANIISTGEFLGLLALAVLPVLCILAISVLVRRSQDLRLAAVSMTHAAIRLTEPETDAADQVASIGQAVRREVNALGDGLERALSRAGELEVMVHNEVTALERTYSENEHRLRGLIQELTSQREAVTTNSDRVREAIAEAHSSLIGDLDRAGGRLTDTIAGRAEEARTALDRASDDLNASFTARVNQLEAAIETRGDSLSMVLDTGVRTISNELDSRAITFEKSIEEKTANLSEVFLQSGNHIMSGLEKRGYDVNEAISAIGTRVVEDLSARVGDVEGSMNHIAAKLDESMSIRLNAMDSRLQSAMLEIDSTLEETTEKAGSIMSMAGRSTLSEFDSRMEEVSMIIDNRIKQLDGVVGDRGEILIEALNSHSVQFSTRANLLEEALEERAGQLNDVIQLQSGQLSNTIADRTKEFAEKLGSRSQQISEIMSTRTREFGDVLADRSQKLSEAVENRTNDFAQTIDDRSGKLSNTIEGRTAGFAQLLDDRTGKLSTAIEEQTGYFGQIIENRSEKLALTIKEQTGDFSEALNDRTSQLSEAMDLRTNQFNEALETRSHALSEAVTAETQKLADQLRIRTSEATKNIENQGNKVQARIDTALTEISETMELRTGQFASLVSEKVGEVNENIGRDVDTAVGRLTGAETGLTSNIANIVTQIEEGAENASKVIEGQLSSSRDSITNMVEDRLGSLPEAITARADITADRLSALNEAINESVGRTMADLESSADRIEETVGSRIANASLAISTDVEQTAARMDVAVRNALDQIREASRHMEDLVEVRAVETADTLTGKVASMHETLDGHVNQLNTSIEDQTKRLGDLVTNRTKEIEEQSSRLGEIVATRADTLEEQTTRYTDLVAASTQELDGSLKNHGNILRQALQESATQSEDIMAASTSKIMVDVTQALTKLNESNVLLQQVLETSTGSLTTLENSISGQTASYSDAVREAVASTEDAGVLVTQHVSALRNTLQSVSTEFGSLLANLDTETNSINNAANSLHQAGNVTIQSLEGRREALEALVGSFTDRADEIDGRMRAFSVSIAETVTDTEDRLREARAAMEQTVQSTSGAVAGEIESLVNSAGTEGERAADRVRKIQDGLVAEMQSAFETATHRFAETAEAMRETAGQVGRELESTRSELQRGVLELPEETRASAAAMRRVVAEQIDALNELNNIVRSQPGTHGLGNARSRQTSQRSAEPSYRADPAPRQSAAPAAPEPAFVAAPVQDAPPRRLQAAEARAPQPAPQPIPQTQPAPVQAAPAPRAPIAPRAAEPSPEGGDTGWLRNVLRNASASSEQATPSARTSINLTNLTQEIAQAMDNSALSDAWQRYRAGESNVFSRRIYTLTGQGTFDEVRKKLQRDNDFASAAKEYMEEFEQLIGSAAAEPGMAEAVHGHLTSDRGKVYTMLAHASSRLS